MFKKLKAHWNVNGINLVLIIATFALGGSLCGYAGRKILLLTDLEKGPVWIVLYLLLITLLWPICVLLISFELQTQVPHLVRRVGVEQGHTNAAVGLDEQDILV